MRVHKKTPRRPAEIATGISVGSVAIGIAVMTAGIAVVALNPYENNTGPIAFIGCAGIAALAVVSAFGWPALAASQQYHNQSPKEKTMSAITGNEPNHWHDEHGHHRMNDPRRAFGENWKIKTGDWTSADERAYTEHLIAHESQLAMPQAQPDDSELVQSLIAIIDNAEHTKRTAAALVAALRQQQQDGEDE